MATLWFWAFVSVAVALLAWFAANTYHFTVWEFGVNFDKQPGGRSIAELMKGPFEVENGDPYKVMFESFINVKRRDLFQLFHASDKVPQDINLAGEYYAFFPSQADDAVQTAANWYVNSWMGPGMFSGIAFKSYENGTGEGYNVYTDDEYFSHRLHRFNFSYGPSEYDGKEALVTTCLANCTFLLHGMRDEIRFVHHFFFVGIRSVPALGGHWTASPFVIFSHVSPWVNPDKPPMPPGGFKKDGPKKKKKRYHGR